MRSKETIIRSGVVTAVFGLLFTISAFDIAAQMGRVSSTNARRIEEFNKQGRKAVHDEMNREMRRKKPSKEDLQKASQIKKETIKDLETLQSNYNSMILRLAERTTPERSFIKEITDSTESSAARLRANLALPRPDETETPDEISTAEPDVRLRMHTLCVEIYGLLTSPAVENPNVVDVETAAATRNRLDRIIRLSELVRTAQQ